MCVCVLSAPWVSALTHSDQPDLAYHRHQENQSSMCVRVFKLSVSALTHSDRPDLHKNIFKPLSLLVARVNPSVKDKEVPHSTMKITLFYKILQRTLFSKPEMICDSCTANGR